jgi:hypothetical protein
MCSDIGNVSSVGSNPTMSTNGLKHEGRNNIVAIKRIRTKPQISQLGKRESGQ